jgi:GNAT superfamily N-acetyltransferase
MRKASIEDAYEISLLYKVVWDEQKGSFPEELLHARQPDRTEMEKWLSRETYFVAEVNRKIVGVVGCFMEFGNCKLVHMAVLKEFRGKGIGGMLIEEVEKFARRNNANKIWLDTSTRLKESIEFYKRKGFRLVGKLKKHFYGEDILLFEKLL